VLLVCGLYHGNFISFRDIKVEPAEKLSFLHQIRDKRLAQPPDSPHRMENVCNLIPETLEGVDLESIGYHRQCYQLFTKNQDRLKQLNSPESTSSSSSKKTLFTSQKISV